VAKKLDKVKKPVKGSKSVKKPRINKDEIGAPSNFTHVSHMGLDPNTGVIVSCI
jgi:hypothetical protein